MKLTDDQLKKLAESLAGTRKNVYREAEALGCKFEEDDWDRLGPVANIFKCENCDKWLNVAERDRDVTIFCKDCVDTIDE